MVLDNPLLLGAIGAGLAVGIAGCGSGIGAGIAGASGAGVIAEDPSKFGTAIVFQALPQTQGLYGFLVAILILFVFKNAPEWAMLGAGIAAGLAGLSAIGQGIASSAGVGAVAEDEKIFGKAMVFSVLPETQAIYGLLVAILLLVGVFGNSPGATTIAALGAGVATGLAGLSGIGQGIASSAGVGAVAEDEKIFGKAMVFSVLPETQAIYGLLVAILLLVGVFGNSPGATTIAALGAGLAVGFAGLSGIGQGITAAGAIGATARDPEAMGKGLVLAVMPETFAIFGLLIAILIMLGIMF